MVRLLLTVFFVGLIVSCACWGVVAAMGGPDNGWGPNFTRYNDGHWSWNDDRDGGGNQNHSATLGEMGTRDIAWNGSTRLEVNIPAEIDYTQGPDAKVTITGPQNLIDNITVNDGAINYANNWSWKRRGSNPGVHLTIQAPSVTKFELNGAAKMTISAYRQDSMDLQVNGAAKVNASGQANRLHLELNGASNAEMGSVLNDDADVELNGASSVTIAPRLSARVEINGVGHARLLTHPANMQQEIHGVGSITYGSDSPIASSPAQPATPLPLPSTARPSPPVAPTQKPHAKATAT
jgi:hypothetical protein